MSYYFISTIFKTYTNDLDGITNKLGFSKRTFAEWGSQVSQSFKEAEVGANRFTTFFKRTWAGTKTAFHAPQEINNIQLIPEADFSSVFNTKDATSFFNSFNKNGSASLSVLTKWCDGIGVADDTMRSYLTECMQKQVPASFEGYNNYVKTAINGTKQLSLGMKALSVAGNMLLTIGITMAISAIIKGIDYLIHRTEKMQEALQTSVDDFNSVTDELKSLEEEIKTTTERLAELQKLADNGTISVAEEAELEILKKTNKELARKVALKQQEQAQEARDVLKDSKKNANSKVDSKYKRNDTREGDYGVDVLADEELQLAIESYEKIDKILSTGYLGDTKLNDAQIEAYRSKQDENASRIKEMYALVSPTIEAYEDLIDAGIKLEGEDKTRYEQLKATQDEYMAYIYAINGTKEAFEGLNTEQQRNVLLNRLVKQGLSEDVAKAIVGSISDEDLSKYWDKNFSFVPPEMKDGETAEEYGKRYAEAWAKGLEEGAKNANKMTVSLSELEGASDKIKTLGSAFKELSDDGYITTKTLGEIQTATGLSGDEWENYKTKLLNAKSGSSEFNQIMSEMTYKILDNAFASKDLTSITEDEVEAILRENGVVNASAVAHDWLSRVKNKEKATNFELGKTVDETKSKLIEEAKSCGITTAAYAQLVAQEIVFNQNDLDISGKIQKLATLQQALGNTTSTAILLNNALSSTNTSGRPERDFYLAVEKYGIKKTANGLYEYNGVVYKAGMDAVNAAMAAEFTKGVNVEIPKVDYSGASSSSGSDKNKPDYEDPTDAIINRINLRSKEIEKQEEEIQNLIEIAELENDYKKQISLTNELIAKRKERLTELETANAGLHNEAEYLRNSNPYDEESWFDSQGNATEAYYNVLNSASTKEEQERIKDLFESLSKYKEAYKDNTEEILALNKELLQDEENLNELHTSQHEITVRDIEHARDMALNADENANVNSYYKQLQDEYHREAERFRELDPEKYKEEIQKLQQLWWDAQNEMLDYNKQVVDDFLNELQTELDDYYDLRISRLNSQSSLLSTHFGLVNAIEEEQHNLNKELLEAETIGARMNEQERESLFTKAEHARLSSKLNDIVLDISDLQNDYMRDLNKATSDTIDEITNHYERQYELKMKEYEIVKAELSLAKAQQVLENTENEKSVRTWNGSSWVYEANLQDVINAQEDVENAKYELARAQAEEAQQVALNAIGSKTDALETEKNKFATAIDEMAEKMSGSGKDITDMLKTIAETDLPTFDAIIQSMGDSIKTALNISDGDIDSIRRSGGDVAITSDAIEQMKANSAAWHTADKDIQTKLSNANKAWGDALGLDYEDSTGRWKKKDGTYAYATGTKNAHKGVGLFDEEGLGSEFILTNDGVLTQFQGGEHVFSPEMADRLWEMAQQNYTFTPIVNQSDFGKLIPIEDKINNAISNISNAFGDTYMVNGVQLSESEGGTLKGFINFLKKKI